MIISGVKCAPSDGGIGTWGTPLGSGSGKGCLRQILIQGLKSGGSPMEKLEGDTPRREAKAPGEHPCFVGDNRGGGS